MISRLSFRALVLVSVLVYPCIGHHGHDHDHGSGDDHNVVKEDMPETDPKWINAHKEQGAGVTLRWISDENDKDWITMKMSTQGDGWLAVGFCSRWLGSMEGCDVALGWVDNGNGTAHIFDYYVPGPRNSMPKLDEKQNYELVEGSQTNGFTSITFKRKWNTEDDNQDADIEHNHVHVMFASNGQDPISPEQFEMHSHDAAGRGHTAQPISFKGHHHDHDGNSASTFSNYSFFVLLFCLFSTVINL